MTPRDALLRQVQANVLTGYHQAYCARLLFCEIPEDAVGATLRWLRGIAPQVSYEGDGRQHEYRLNLAFTHAGLKRLGVSDAELLGTPTAFAQGLTRRAPALGDRRPPRDRDAMWDDRPLHMVVLLYADFTDRSDAQSRRMVELLLEDGEHVRLAHGTAHTRVARELADRLAMFLNEVESQNLPPLPERVTARRRDLHHPLISEARGTQRPYPIEYFGFRDGVRNPRPLEESAEACREFVLASAEPLLDHGSYLVVRELHQDVEGFWREIQRAAHGSASAVELAERVIGRRRDGEPLEPAAPGGLSFVPGSRASACPFASHVRRANPQIEAGRAANPRLIRRGLSYMDADGRCGLMFMAFVSDIEEQFEFIQKNWVQRANHVGQLSAHHDAVAGGACESAARTELALGAGQTLSLSQFVSPGEGAYLFVPSRGALQRIIQPSPCERWSQGTPAEGKSVVEETLDRLTSVDEKILLIQQWLDQSDAAARFWRFVESRAKQTWEVGPYIFIAQPESVLALLRDGGESASVCEYMKRMRPSTGEFLLGRDANSQAYQREKVVRTITDGVDPERVAAAAELAVRRVIEQRAFLHHHSNDPAAPLRVELRTLLAAILDAVVGRFFGLPGASTASLAIWGRATARYHFRPFPDAADRAKAIQASQEYRSHVNQLLAEAGPDAADERAVTLHDVQTRLRSVLGAVRGPEAEVTEDDVARNLIGIVTGALGATMKLSFEGLTLYIREHASEGSVDWAAMQSRRRWEVFAETLQRARRGGPDVLYRSLGGESAKLAVLWIGGAQQADAEVLFGAGDHKCPGQSIGIAMIEGLLNGLIALEAAYRVLYVGEYEELRLELRPRL